MNHHRRAFWPLLGAFAAVLLFAATDLSAQQTTGKIEGLVRDPAGQPVAGAQVLILGTSFAATTNESGYYFIINIPSGVYSLRSQFIGYQPAEVRGARVLAGQTLTVNFGLSGAVALEAIVVSVAEQPIVPRDQVTSKWTVTNVDQLPVEDGLQLVLLQPGVTQARGGAISIRGGRTGEAVIFVDGAPVRRLRTGGTPLSVATNALEEVSVTTGAMDAAFGDAQAGVISFVTTSGGPDFVGTLSYETDEPFGNAVSVGWNRFEAALSGPIAGNLTFSVGGTLNGQKTGFFGKGAENVPSFILGGIDTVMTVLAENSTTDSTSFAVPRIVQYGGECDASANFGFECQGRRAPYSWTTDLRLTGKLQMTYGSGSRVSLSALNNVNQGQGSGTMNIEGGFGTRTNSNLLVLNWVQQVFRKTESQLAFDVNLSYQTDQFINGNLERDQDLNVRDPALGIQLSPLKHIIDFENFSNDTQDDYPGGGVPITQLKTDEDWDQLVKNVRTNTGTLRPYLDRRGIIYSTIPRVNAWGLTQVPNLPTNVGADWNGFTSLDNERRITARANIDWQADRYNRIKIGAEGLWGRLNRFQSPLTRLSFGDFYTAEPVKMAAYIQDRLDLGDVVVELGVRWDRFDARTYFPLVPGRIFTHPDFDPALAEPTDNAAIWKKSEARTAVSPRVRVSFPVTDRTGFRLSYAHQVQAPTFNNIYEGTNNDLANTNTNDRFGGDVDFGKTILFEFGIRHAFNRDMVLDVSAYNKDKVSDHTYRILPFFDPFSERVSNVNILTNADFGNVRGVDVQLIRRFSNIFSGQVSYTLQNAKSTGSDPTDFLNGLSRQPAGVTGARPEPPQTTLRTRDDRRHNLQGTFTASFPADFEEGTWYGDILKDVGVFGTFQFRSGLPYTRLTNTGVGNRSNGGLGLVQNTIEPLQASETPWQKFFDLRVTKGFRFGRLDWTVYADVRNVLNFDIRNAVFSETGDIVNDEYFRTRFRDPGLLSMEQDATASGAWITTDAGVNAIDLTLEGPTAGCSVWGGFGGPVSCVMLQRAESRFGNGDGVYTVDEQTAAVESLYLLNQGPYTFLAAPRHIRVGAQLTF